MLLYRLLLSVMLYSSYTSAMNVSVSSNGYTNNKLDGLDEVKVVFRSLPKNSFRIRIESPLSKEKGAGVLLWAEERKSKEQWQIVIINFSEYASSSNIGIPDQAVLEFLQVTYNKNIVDSAVM